MNRDELKKAAAPIVELLKQIPLKERDRERLPIVGRMIAGAVRTVGHVGALRAELLRAHLAGATHEELAARINDAKGLAEVELEELRGALESWPARERKRSSAAGMIVARTLPKVTK